MEKAAFYTKPVSNFASLPYPWAERGLAASYISAIFLASIVKSAVFVFITTFRQNNSSDAYKILRRCVISAQTCRELTSKCISQ